jgi:hypothetical protein
LKLVKIWGGIGNQLFQYYFGQFLLQYTNESVIYVNEIGKSTVPSKLHFFLNLNLELPKHGLTRNNFPLYFSRFYRLNRKFLNLFPFCSSKIKIENSSQNFQKEFLDYELFDGYWQDLFFLEDLKRNSHFSFSFSDNIIYQQNSYYQLIMNAPNAISVHVRRGDYLKSRYHVLLGMDYYRLSMEAISQKIANPTFFIFSDDMNWVKENFPNSLNIVFVFNFGVNHDDILDFYLMSLCKHHIIANSTFSWWPAYLKDQSNNITIAPKHWYNYDDISNRIIMKEWILQ